MMRICTIMSAFFTRVHISPVLLATGSTFGNVYGSSTSMFVFIKNSIKRCTALTTGKTFLSLSKEFKTCMMQYIDLLMNRCPPAMSIAGTSLVTYKLPPNGELTMCYLINTGEYCAEVVPQLEQMIQQKMQPSLSSKVSFDTVSIAWRFFLFNVLVVYQTWWS